MKIRINYDKEVDIGYFYVFSKKYKYTIEETEELEVNPFLSLDIDEKKAIVGIELFGEEASEIKNLVNEEHTYTKKASGISLRINEKEVTSKYSFLGIDFCFARDDYKGFVGFDVVDNEKYPEDKLI